MIDACCGVLHAGGVALTAESLMRSRYTAYFLARRDYLLKSWHPETRPDDLVCAPVTWLGLTVINVEAGAEEDDRGSVEFTASYVRASQAVQMHEMSQFFRVDGLWLYYDGKCEVSNIGHNSSCPCGSGLKLKRCCLGKSLSG